MLCRFVLAFALVAGCETPGPRDPEQDERDRALIEAMSEGSSMMGTLDGQRAQYNQQQCGNGDCTGRVDSLGRDYCTCKGRRGRAVLSCCGL